MIESLTPLFASAVAAAIPLVIAGLGELITERSGVLNLGMEGMMLLGAVAAFAAVFHGGGLHTAVIAGCVAGALAALVFAVLTLSLQASQVATGLSLTILGSGVAAFLGRGYVGSRAVSAFEELPIPVLSELPLVGPALFSMNLLGYAAILLVAVTAWFLFRTRAGLILRSVGESPTVAHSIGLPVIGIRYAATLYGGAMAGLAGCYYAVAQFKMWQEGLTSGNGWIALALVVFASWRPGRILVGALLFGGVSAFGLYVQAIGAHVSTFALSSLPYIATIVVLAATSRNRKALKRNAPASLGQPYFASS
jgi:simple sugar transport system permease protein